jgi:hypothetical protein
MSVYELRASVATNMIPSAASETQQPEERAQQRIESGTRLIVLAVPGFLIFMLCCSALIIELSYGEPFVMDPRLAPLLALISALMILAGAGQWGRWGYLWVFLSIPIAGLVWASLFQGNVSPDPLQTYPKRLGMAVFALPLIGSYTIVKRYYSRKALPEGESVPRAQYHPTGKSRSLK